MVSTSPETGDGTNRFQGHQPYISRGHSGNPLQDDALLMSGGFFGDGMQAVGGVYEIYQLGTAGGEQVQGAGVFSGTKDE